MTNHRPFSEYLTNRRAINKAAKAPKTPLDVKEPEGRINTPQTN